MSKFKEFWKTRKDTLVLSVLASIALPLILCVAVPLEIFKNNMLEFTFSLMDFWWICLLLGLGFSVLFFVILMVLPKLPRRIMAYTLIMLAFMAFIQGNYLNAGINSLTGDGNGETEISMTLVVINLMIWIVVIALAVFFAIWKDKKGIIKSVATILSIVVIATQLMSFMVSSFTTKNLYRNKNSVSAETGEYSYKSLTNEGLTKLSNSSNIYYFVLDRFDEKFALEAYQNQPDIYDNLTGFTWFQDYISLYGHTFPGVVSMLTNKPYMEEKGREEFLKTAYEGENPLSELVDNGYEINLYTQEYYAYVGGNLPDYVSNLKGGKLYATSKLQIALRMCQLAVYRCVPLLFKLSDLMTFGTQSMNYYTRFEANDGAIGYKLDSKINYEIVRNVEFETTDTKKFSFIHLDGCHGDVYDDNWKKLSSREATNTQAVKNSFAIVDKYIEKLKEKGLYESATIIITGDHGIPSGDDDCLGHAMQTALFVKPAGSGSGSLKISNSQVSQNNIWKTIFGSVGITSGLTLEKSVFEVGDEPQTRYNIWQTWNARKTISYKFEITGDGSDFDNWKIVEENKYNHGIAV